MAVGAVGPEDGSGGSVGVVARRDQVGDDGASTHLITTVLFLLVDDRSSEGRGIERDVVLAEWKVGTWYL